MRPRMLALATAALALTACSSSDVADTAPSGSSRPLHAPPNFDPSTAGYVACSRVVVEGDVLSVTDAGTGHMTTTLKVARWVKPTSGGPTVKVTTADIAAEGVYERWKPGTHLFLVASVDPDALPDWQFTPAQFDAFRAAVPAANALSCPYGPTA